MATTRSLASSSSYCRRNVGGVEGIPKRMTTTTTMMIHQKQTRRQSYREHRRPDSGRPCINYNSDRTFYGISQKHHRPFYMLSKAQQFQPYRRMLSTIAGIESSSEYDQQQHHALHPEGKSFASSSVSSATASSSSSSVSSASWIQNEIKRYSAQDPIERAFTPPSSWYTEDAILEHEKDHVFLCNSNNNINVTTKTNLHHDSNNNDDDDNNNNNWVAIDSGVGWEGGSFQTGQFLGQPYLFTRTIDHGPLRAFYNICTHGGSCLVGPWTTSTSTTTTTTTASTEGCGDDGGGSGCGRRDDDDTASTSLSSSPLLPTSKRLGPDLVGKAVKGILPTASRNTSKTKERRGTFACPYHGWEFDIDGRLVKATHVTGIEDFKNKEYGLKPIAVKEVGPIVFMNFAAHVDYDTMDNNWTLLSNRLEESGFEKHLATLDLIAKEEYTVRCNWKIFVDNYGDGCYHCGYAHADLASNIDEAAYSTDIMSSELSIQNAPPVSSSTTSTAVQEESSCDVRFGNKRAVYAQWYPNVMFNRYGPWFDVDIVIPIDAGTCQIRKAWYIERDFIIPSDTYLDECLKSSRQVHDEDVFLCENVQLGLSSRGYDRGRYVPTKQIAAHMFHRRLARDLQVQ
jgi:choline monooxygenase